MATSTVPRTQTLDMSSGLWRQMRPLLVTSSMTLFALILLSVFLMPLGYMLTHSLKSKEQIGQAGAPLWPATEATFEYQGEALSLYRVPTETGIRELALLKKGREESLFVDPSNPGAEPIRWEGRWRTLEPAWEFSPRWENFARAWQDSKFGRLLKNTFLIAIPGTIGAVLSAVVVAYGFARFRFPGKRILFMILLATIILPFWVTLIPTYTLFQRIGWVNTYLPLIVPHFFANAYNVFLLRQYFLGLPRELDEAAMIDGAGPFRILIYIIIPQALPAITVVGLFHFFFAWNDFFGPLIYLAGRQELQPISVGIHVFNARYAVEPHLIQATALMAMAIPITIFFLAQNLFMQGVRVTGVEK